ncbi:phosphoglycolate phosphatase domain protein, partial [Vibrio parahaemolyticus V-223/04]
RKSKYVIT